MRSGAMPEDYFDWYPELAPRSHFARMAERVLDADDDPLPRRAAQRWV